MGLDRDEVDMAAQRLRQGDEFPGILFRIIHTAPPDCIRKDPSSGLFEIILTDFHQLFDRIPVGNGHQFSSRFSSVACKDNASVICAFHPPAAHSGLYDSTGGHRDISLADVQTISSGQKMQISKYCYNYPSVPQCP